MGLRETEFSAQLKTMERAIQDMLSELNGEKNNGSFITSSSKVEIIEFGNNYIIIDTNILSNEITYIFLTYEDGSPKFMWI